MAIDLLISSDPWENRVALLEDGVLAEIYIERDEKVIGSIFKGKVQNVLPGMGASFVDIGLGRNAFLYVDDINKTPLNIGDVEITQGRTGWTINEKVNRGDDVLVQIVKEPRGLKGARISTNISLPGRYLILMPTGRYSGVSRKIESAEERNRLKNIMKRIRPEGMATVVRTAAAGVSDAELMADLGVLIRMWHGILEQYKVAAAPALLHKDMNLVYKAARDFITPEVGHVYIDNEEEFEKVRDFMRLLGPQYLNRIEHYNSGRSLFKDFKIDEELQKLMRSKVNLPSGGSIVIETTEALTVIDVNSGKFTGGRNLEDTIVKTNVEAAGEIARQVRLRDIGGIIVCDFIDMNTEASRTRVLQTLEAGLRKDRTRTTIQSFSALGLLEFTRKRVGKDLAGQLRSMCPTCHGAGGVLSPESVAIDTFRRIRLEAPKHIHAHAIAGNGSATHEHVSANGALTDGAPANGAAANGANGVYVEASPNVAAQIEFWYEDDVKQLSESVGAPIHVWVDRRVHPEAPRIGYGAPPPPDPAEASVEIRVGDEFDVTVLPGRLPTPNAALAVVAGKLVEIENGAGAIGQRIRIRIIDVDGDDVLAEPRAPVPGVTELGERRKRRRRGGRGRTKPLTIEEQTDELLELAEEAQRGLGGRTSAIGISTTADAEMEDASVKAGATQKKVAELEAGISSEPAVPIVLDENGEVRRRRRRRRRGRRGAEGEAVAGVAPVQGVDAVADEAEEDEEDETLEAGTEEVPGESGTAAGIASEELRRGRRRRRRRRRRRGAGGEGAPETAAMPDRHIFRVGTDGETVPTGETAPPEPVRAIAQVEVRRREVAIEPPPPSLSAPAESDDVKRTKPSRRRPAPPAEAGQLEFTPIAALTGGSEPAAGEPEAPKRRGRTTTKAKAADAAAEAATPAATATEGAPKRRTTRKTPTTAPAAEPAEASAKPVKAKRRTAAEKAADEAAAAPARPPRRAATRKAAEPEPEAAPAAKRTPRKRASGEAAPAAPAARKRTASTRKTSSTAKKTSRKKS